ncbi:MAG: hypothetical protein HY902_13075 [Deltaproteobacteria bacterium]|nr:hypothetical protein [Deltaproteobacteria bacterium]
MDATSLHDERLRPQRPNRLGHAMGGLVGRTVRVARSWSAAAATLAALASGSAVLLNSQEAAAQSAEMGLPPIAQDRGLRTGEFTLYPSMGLMTHYDTNLFNGSDKENNAPVGATSLRFIPRLSLMNDGNGNVNFAFAGTGDARLYISDNAIVSDQKAVGGNLNLDVTFGQKRSMSLTLFNYFNRALRTNNWATIETLNRVANDVGARIEFHPGDIPERRPFNIAIGGSYAIDAFDNFTVGNTTMIRTKLAGSWRFLPKTAAVLDATWDFRKYESSTLAKQGLAADSKPFRARLGLTGALTKRISAQALAGWGLSTHSTGSSYNGFLGSLGVGLRASESTRLYLTYDHDFVDSFFGNFVAYHRFGVSLKQRFGNVLDVTGSFGTRLMSFGVIEPKGVLASGLSSSCDGAVAGKSGCRSDTGMDAALVAAFELHRLVGMNIGWNMRKVITNFKVLSAANSSLVLDVGEYTAHEIYATVVLRY